MLKIEKTSRNLEVFIRLKNRRFNRTFFKALACALFIHLLGLILFTVNPFNLGKERILAPTLVEADLNLPDNSRYNVLAQPEEEGSTSRYALRPPLWSPKFPEMPIATLQSQFESVKEQNSSENPFTRIEYDPESLLFSETVLATPPIQVRITGELADLSLLENGVINTASNNLGDLTDAVRIIYAVQVEGKSGKVFWYYPLELTESKTINQLTETIVAGLRFEEDPHKFANTGEIEIVFNLGFKPEI